MQGLERLTVKRRRDEEPLDTLYIQHKKLRPSTFWRRIPSSESSLPPTITLGNATNKKVTIARTNEERSDSGFGSAYDPRGSDRSESDNAALVKVPSRKNIAESSGQIPNSLGLRQNRHHREYNISKTEGGRIERRSPKVLRLALLGRQGQTEQTLKKGNHADQLHGRRTDFQLLIEGNEALSGHRSRETVKDDIEYIQEVQVGQNQNKTSQLGIGKERRKPFINAAEAARKSATQRGQTHPADRRGKADHESDSKVGNVWDCSEDLAIKLKTMVMEDTKSVRDGEQIKVAYNPKHKPKPAPPRTSIPVVSGFEEPQHDRALSGQKDWDEDGMVYDVFVKESCVTSHYPSALPNEQSSEEEVGRVGVLFIDNEEELQWDIFEDEEGSGPEWSSDEDENAEGHYGNDYPDEDDVVSSDNEDFE